MCSTEKYLNSLLAVTDIQDEIVNHLQSLTRIIGNNDCNVSDFFGSHRLLFNPFYVKCFIV